jgi:hypothetical protein
MHQSGTLIAAAVLATIIGAKGASADFCGDVQAAFAQSANFANLRGAATGDEMWRSNIGIAGASRCIISRPDKGKYSLYCIMKKVSDGGEANKEFSALVSQMKSCAP